MENVGSCYVWTSRLGPASSWLEIATNTLQYPGWVGRLQKDLLSWIWSDLRERTNFFKNLCSFYVFRN